MARRVLTMSKADLEKALKSAQGDSVSFEVAGSGVTASIQAFARQYIAANPHATFDAVCWAWMEKHGASRPTRDCGALATVATQVRAALNS